MLPDNRLLQIDALLIEMGELNAILDAEFEAIKHQVMDQLENIQKKKEDILTRLSDERLQTLAMSIETPENLDKSTPSLFTKWENLRHTTIETQEKLKRNEVLIQRKLTVLRDAIQTLYNTDNEKNLLLYNRLGKLSHSLRSL